MQDAKSTELTQKDVVPMLPPEQLNQLVALLGPAIESMISASLSDVMTVPDFAKARGVSARLVWQWLDEGVLLRAPTDNTGKGKTRVLVNVSAWREKLRQQAVNCRYIDSKA
ncbi:Cro/Cl family transcriptional regulator [Brenneria populi]|uniref:Cro/Cl family transcriptional regulator n=2 Tax=Brenneria TaxID=71655 RepID=A0A2U1TJK7_9GAMM|nr:MULTISPECIES: Cro/Cl family transcriptional regulator [Brenneria]MEC5345058.1 Cro/Cl family transcriptional regulator [Brenneria populi Li et al. 2015]PWC09596.1 Cro/Cl family transcriptional regulator [Brenneria sp. CFCC 11842]